MPKINEKSIEETISKDLKKIAIRKNIKKVINKWRSLSLKKKSEFLKNIASDLSFLPEIEQEFHIKELSRVEICKQRDLKKALKKFTKEAKPEEEGQSKQKFNPRPYSEGILKEYSLRSDLLKRLWIYNKDTGIWNDRAEIFLDS